MFYQEEIGPALRFGDVLKGFILATPTVDEPTLPQLTQKYTVDINFPNFFVVVSPCCSITDNVIALTPLIKLRNTFWDNSYFTEDFTRINRKMEPQQAVPPELWQSFKPEEKSRRLGAGFSYSFLELFIYEKNPIFPNYSINRRRGGETVETNYYMIDFRNTFKVNCKKVVTAENSPLETKCLQLSVQTRAELRDKIINYYGRVPEEEKTLLES